MEVRSVEAIVRALNDSRVEYLIVGGLAVNAHGYMRGTRDVDLVIGLEPENARRGLEALLGIGYQLAIPVTPDAFADPEKRVMWRREKNMIVLKLWSEAHQKTPVDIFIYEPFPFQAEFEIAPRFEVAPGLMAPFVGLGRLLEMKREANRLQDQVDIQELTRSR